MVENGVAWIHSLKVSFFGGCTPILLGNEIRENTTIDCWRMSYHLIFTHTISLPISLSFSFFPFLLFLIRPPLSALPYMGETSAPWSYARAVVKKKTKGIFVIAVIVRGGIFPSPVPKNKEQQQIKNLIIISNLLSWHCTDSTLCLLWT